MKLLKAKFKQVTKKPKRSAVGVKMLSPLPPLHQDCVEGVREGEPHKLSSSREMRTIFHSYVREISFCTHCAFSKERGAVRSVNSVCLVIISYCSHIFNSHSHGNFPHI